MEIYREEEFNKIYDQLFIKLQDIKNDLEFSLNENLCINEDRFKHVYQNQITIMKDIKDIKHELRELKNNSLQPLQCCSPLPQVFSTRLSTSSSNAFHNKCFEPEGPHIFLHEALKRVPEFNGEEGLYRFILACHQAKEMVPSSSEKSLTKLLINRLFGDAYTVANLVHCETVENLIDTLCHTFDPLRSVKEYYKDLSFLCQKTNESILSYIQRTKNFRTLMLDAERREHGEVTINKQDEIDAEIAKVFCEGLLVEFRFYLSNIHYTQLSEAFSYVMGMQNLEKKTKKETKDKEKMSFISSNPFIRSMNVMQKNNAAEPQAGPSNYRAENQKWPKEQS